MAQLPSPSRDARRVGTRSWDAARSCDDFAVEVAVAAGVRGLTITATPFAGSRPPGRYRAPPCNIRNRMRTVHRHAAAWPCLLLRACKRSRCCYFATPPSSRDITSGGICGCSDTFRSTCWFRWVQ
jgi:hypothetical protein